MVLLLSSTSPYRIHDTVGTGLPVTSQRNVTCSPSATSTVRFDRLVIFGGTVKMNTEENQKLMEYLYETRWPSD